MGKGPAPFSDIGKSAKDLLTKDYNFDQKFTLTMLGNGGLGLTTTGIKKDQFFTGDLSTVYKCRNTTVDVKIDTSSNLSTTITVNDVFPRARTALSFKIPDHKSSKLDVQYLHDQLAIKSSIGLTPTPLLEFSVNAGSTDLSLGGEIGFDTASSSFTKYNTGISLSKEDYSAALILADKGEALKASYIHVVDPINGTAVAAEWTHKIKTSKNSFTFGASHKLDPVTLLKARISDTGKMAALCQREWRPKSLVTISAEIDPKDIDATTKFGLGLALKA